MFDRDLFKMKGKEVYSNDVMKCIIATGIVTLISMVTAGMDNAGSGLKVNVDVPVETFVSSIPIISEIAMIGTAAAIGVLALVIAIVSAVINILVNNVISVGEANFYLKAREGVYDINNLFTPYQGNLKNLVIVMIMQGIIISIYSLFFVIPGIIKAYELRFVRYLLAEDDSLSWREAFEISANMTNGHKMDLFIMDVSFILCHLINTFTGGLGTFITQPYISASFTEAYIALSGRGSVDSSYFQF